ncbi:MAG: CPXCG motif-containing cysteine-rich protein [Candidatus Eisenbacteria bacterium]|uniref:CPXCG motif-containing cysteine-rich protein n=1 Tax=Eiseniibacteriota bacterium TaxID=2212470 RepID=A0A7Y2EC67_UNCEI|nr:CPXCG motif-containing cysteine-rich protein [Candidatus Eisenbacteria bacterium]
MLGLIEKRVRCPYCGESIAVLLDSSVPFQTYVEDCQVCCRPISFSVGVGEGGEIDLRVSQENE